MATPRNIASSSLYIPPAGAYRNTFRDQKGWDGDRTTVYPYTGLRARGNNVIVYSTLNPLAKWTIDAGNTKSLSYITDGTPSFAQPTYNQAYQRFRENAVGDAAELGVFFAEWKESLGVITKNATSLLQSYRKFRKGKYDEVFDPFKAKLSRRRSHDRRKKFGRDAVTTDPYRTAAERWLEYHFAVAPTVSDIYSAVEVLQAPLPSGIPAFGSAKLNFSRRDGSSASTDATQTGFIQFRLGADVYLTNPNLFLANQLGLVNPLSIAWELVPFSFMVDWFVPVGNFLNSYSDFIGTYLDKAYTTQFVSSTDTARPTHHTYYGGTPTMRVHAMKRSAGVIPPKWNTTVTSGGLQTSISRAANAVAILVSVLRGGDLIPVRG